MLALLTLLLTSQFILHTTADTINPTWISNNSEIYEITSSNQYDTVICSNSECEILCNVTNGCYKINIDAQLTDILNLRCINELSCEGITVLSPAAMYNNIECTHKSSCYNARFNLLSDELSSPNISIKCNQTITFSYTYSPCYQAITKIDYGSNIDISCGFYGCYNTQFYINNSDSITFNSGDYGVDDGLIKTSGIINGLTMNANGRYSLPDHLYCSSSSDCIINCETKWACIHNIYIPNRMYTGLQINSFDSELDIDIICLDNEGTSAIHPNSINGRLECSNYVCCPLQFVSDTYTCLSGEECKYECGDITSITCSNSIIDGSITTSLTVECDTDHSCTGTRIICPTANYSSCNINCLSYAHACDYIVIVTDQADYIDTFKFVHSNSYYAWVMFDFVAMNVLSLQLRTTSNRITAQPNIEYGDKIANIGNLIYNCTGNCDEMSTYPFREKGIIIDDLFLYCNDCGMNSLFDFTVKNSVDITCSGGQYVYACDGDIIIELLSVSTDISIDCIDSVSLFSNSISTCSGNFHFIQPSKDNTNSINVNCNGYQACDKSTFDFTNINQVTVICKEDYSCKSATMVANTTSNFNIHCDGDFACGFADIYCPSNDENVCNIDCKNDYYREGVCKEMVIYSDIDYTENYLNFECSVDQNQDCQTFGWSYCGLFCKDVEFHCKDAFETYVTPIIYDYSVGYYKCDDADDISSSDICCPLIGKDDMTTTTTSRTDTTTTSRTDNTEANGSYAFDITCAWVSIVMHFMVF